MNANEAAFLTTISHSEGTDQAPDPYRVVYGYTYTIKDLREHPAITGEWLGEKTPWGHSTAAGRYQIIKPTWIALRDRLKLPDFSGPSQDAAALELIREKGALVLVDAGRVADAITACREIWASLPGSSSGQPQKSFAALISVYGDAGGAFA